MPRNFVSERARCRRGTEGFNEAAADAAEFSTVAERHSAISTCFNEAAADAAEFFLARRLHRAPEPASMRPRQMPRNFAGGGAVDVGDQGGFNEAAADAAEF